MEMHPSGYIPIINQRITGDLNGTVSLNTQCMENKLYTLGKYLVHCTMHRALQLMGCGKRVQKILLWISEASHWGRDGNAVDSQRGDLQSERL